MKRYFPCLLIVSFLLLCPLGNLRAQNKSPFPGFRMEEVERSLKVGYAVVLVDVNEDKKLDIVVVDTTRVLWYENPTWKSHVIIKGQTKPDNVCIAPHDIDGDGKIDFALGADWAPFNTKSGGTLQWLKRGESLDEKWSVHPIGEEPVVHRHRWADTNGDGKKELIVVPLMGRGSSRKNNWMDGAPVRILAFHIPKNPMADRWKSTVVDQSLHVVHNFWPIPARNGKGHDILAASYEGVTLLTRDKNGKRKAIRLGKGNQQNPKGSRGASEVKLGTLKGGRKFIATIEPWHGYQVVVYLENKEDPNSWDRLVLDDKLRWGHAIQCADLDGDGGEELIIGVRDDPRKNDSFKDRRGIRLYRPANKTATRWTRQVIENGGIAVEDMAAGDLNGDGRIDLIAVGRQTHNMRIYWNEGND